MQNLQRRQVPYRTPTLLGICPVFYTGHQKIKSQHILSGQVLGMVKRAEKLYAQSAAAPRRHIPTQTRRLCLRMDPNVESGRGGGEDNKLARRQFDDMGALFCDKDLKPLQ